MSGGACDGNLTSAMGIPTICGMGREGYGCHREDEYVEIELIFERTKLLAQVLFKGWRRHKLVSAKKRK